MNINSSQNVNSMDAFMRLVQTARVRNGGFETPVADVQHRKSAQAVSSVPQQLKAAGKLSQSAGIYAPVAAQHMEKPKQVLGTRFDAYA